MYAKDPSYSKLFASVLSTSNCGTRALDLFGFGPVVDNGFGLGYMIHPEVFAACILVHFCIILALYSYSPTYGRRFTCV